MQIKLNRGIDEIVFGMTEQDVISMIGNPDKVNVDTNGSRDLIYFRQKLILKIEPNNRLAWIEVHNNEAICLDICPWQISKAAVLQRLSEFLNDEYELDDFGRMESYSYKSNWLELQYEFGELYAFNFGVGYDENEEPIWPV